MKLFAGFGAIAGQLRKKPGMVLLSPTSITNSGGSASIGTNGQVTFTSVTSLSLNGVFSATYDNYVLSMQLNTTGGTEAIYARLRASGTDASGANTYVNQYVFANNTSVTAARSTTDYFLIGAISNTSRNGTTVFLYGPYLAQPTATRNIGIYATGSAAIADYATTHSVSSSYDGITIYNPQFTMTGTLTVMGVRG